MPSIRTSEQLAAGGQNGNVLQGNQFEFIQAPSRVQVFAVAAALVAGGVGEVEVFFGQELQHPQAACNQLAATVVTGPNINEDLIVDDYAAPGDRLVIRIVESSGAQAVEMRTLTKITPMPV